MKPTLKFTYKLGHANVSEFHVPACQTKLKTFFILNCN